MTLEKGTHWRIAEATRAAVVIDADAYFRAAREAMLKARHQILLVGWDFDARITLAFEDDHPEAPTTVGEFIGWLVKRTPTLQVYILRWEKGALKTLGRGRTLWTLLKWRLARRIHLKLDAHHPIAASHHQKIVVIDDCLAFCGGIDMTDERWDTRAHTDDDPRRKSPSGFAYKPWHDVTSALEGPVARVLGELCRTRWQIAGGRKIAPPPPSPDCWPESLTPHFRDVEVAVSRSQPDHGGLPAVREIEELYLWLIARAKRRLYAESQYFASRRIAEAIAKRVAEDDPPEIVIINPVTAQGWLEPIAMDTARERLIGEIERRDHRDRFRMYHPVTTGGEPIYCHAKVMVVDEEIIRIGSSNFNNRSLRLDTECDITIREESAVIPAIRDDLIAEHLDVPISEVAEGVARDGLIATIERLRGEGKTLVPYEPRDLNEVQQWLADNEVLDPEGPDEMFEAFAQRKGLLRRLRRRR